MQVGRAQVDRVDQHLVQELDDRRVLDLRGGLGLFLRGLRILVGDLELEVGGDQRLHRLRGGGLLVGDQAHQLVVLDDDPLGRELRGELDALDGFLVGRVGAGDEQAAAALAEREDAVLGDQLLVDDALRQLLRIDGVQVEQRHGQRRGQRVRQRQRLHRVRFDELGHERAALVVRQLRQVFGRLRFDATRTHQDARNPREVGLWCVEERVNCHRRGAAGVWKTPNGARRRSSPMNKVK